jgi:putative CocE/NonD family hydrolase
LKYIMVYYLYSMINFLYSKAYFINRRKPMIAPRITMLVAILATLAACSSTGGGSLSPSTEKMVASDRDESPNKPDATVQARCPSENTAAVTQYERYVRSSHYVKVRDGTLIAADVYRPSGRGQLHETSLPAVWTYTPYLRALKGPAGNVVSSIDGPIGEAFCRAGYVHVVADVRGTGASYGIQKGIFTGEEAADVYDITEWIAGQVWCDGSVGMMGGSYAGVAQLMGATMKPPHLKAIFPAMALFDLYSFAYHGGVFFDKCLSLGDREQRLRNERTGRWVAPVDEDPERAMLGEARANHVRERGRSGLFDMFSPLPFRDSVDPYTNDRPYLEWGPSSRLKSLATCGIPVYIYAGWFDLFTRDAFLLYRNLKGPKRLRVVDSAHSQSNDELLGLFITEQIRWFDHWLKGINNGMADASPITVHRVDGSTDDILQLSDWIKAVPQWRTLGVDTVGE